MSDYLPTLIVRSPRENPKKCSVLPLRGRADICFFEHPAKGLPSLDQYIRLAAIGEPLTMSDASRGILLIDASWRRADLINRAYLDVPARVLHGYRTSYPRRSKQGTDPDCGLASVEALYLAYHILGRPTNGLLDHFHWANEFLSLNGLTGEDRSI